MIEKRKKSQPLQPGISREIVAPVADVLRALGDGARDLERLAGDVSIIPGDLADRLLDTAATKLGDQALGLTIAERLPIGALGLLDYALSTSATLREALMRVTEHYGLVTQRVKVRLEEDGASAALVFTRAPHVVHSRHWLELSIAIIAARMRQTLARDIAFHAAFAHVAPKRTKTHDVYFGHPVAFDAEMDRLSFDVALLDSTLKTASTALAALLDAKIRDLAPKDDTDAFLARVRTEMLALLEERNVQLDAIAARLRMARRTFQRELARRKTSHHAMLDEVRRERALVLLGESLTITEVAERLAYSEPSAFFRAFRRWTGTSPRSLKA